MRRTIMATALCAACILGTAAQAGANSLTQTLTGGSLSVASQNIAFSATSLNGSSQTVSSTSVLDWSVVDARGTGAAWSVSIAASTPTSAAGSVETTARTIPVSNLSASTGTISATTGSSTTVNISNSTVTLSNSAQTLVSSTGTSMGTFLFKPTFNFTVPANAYRSNYSGAVGSTSLNPYVSTLTVTIA